jgi:hypothetical protein
MFKGQIENAYATKKIKRVVVLRLFLRPGQTEALLSPHDYVRENKNYRYLLIFIPDMKQVPVAVQTPKDYFIFLNRIDKPDQIRWYKSLFTASQDIAEWGFKSYEVFDLTEHADLEDAFGLLRRELTARKISIEPVRRFMDDLVNRERGLRIPSRRTKAGISI